MIRGLAPLALLLTLGVGCKKMAPGAAGASDEAPELGMWAIAPRELTYRRHRAVSGLELPVEAVQERWTRVQTAGPGRTYVVETGVETGQKTPVLRKFHYGPAGLTILADGRMGAVGEVEWTPWAPPKLVLPAGASTSSSWDGQHAVGDDSVYRSCEIMASTDCPDEGLVVVCDGRWPEFRVVTRDHFCRNVGWFGYESMLIRDGQPPVRTWTRDVQRVD